MVYTITVHLYANADPSSIEKLKAKLIEASRIYRNDKETLDWFVMQSVHDPRAFTIVERYENEGVSVAVPQLPYCFPMPERERERQCCCRTSPPYERSKESKTYHWRGSRARNTTSRTLTGRRSTLT